MKRLVAEAGLSDSIHVESAGTGDWHLGQLADTRTRATAERRGTVLTSRAQLFMPAFFDRFDYVLPADASNFSTLLKQSRGEADTQKLRLLRDFDPKSPKGSDVPDPYYGGADGFEAVYDICEAACRGLLAQIIAEQKAHS